MDSYRINQISYPHRLGDSHCKICRHITTTAGEILCNCKLEHEQIISDKGLPAWKVLYFYEGNLISPRRVLSSSLGVTNSELTWPIDKPLQATNINEGLWFSGIFSYKADKLNYCITEQISSSFSGGYITDFLRPIHNNKLFIVIVKLRIWGVVHRHSYGYRSEFAFPEKIYCNPPEFFLLEKYKYSKILSFYDLQEEENSGIRICRYCNSKFILSLVHEKWFSCRNYALPNSCKFCLQKTREDKKEGRFVEKYLKLKEKRNESDR